MYNLSESIITFEVLENDAVIHSGQIPYDLLSHIKDIYLNGTDRKLRYNVLTTPFEFDNLVVHQNLEDPDTGSFDLSTAEYNNIQVKKAMFDLSAQDAAEMSLFLEAQAAAEYQNSQTINNELSAPGEALYSQLLLNQQQLTEEQAAARDAEQLRIDLLRSQTVTQIAVDPYSSVSALMSEVGETSDVQRQIAACMMADKELTKVIISSTSTLWINSYEILDVAAFQATRDAEIATMLANSIPTDSVLYLSLQNLGLIS